jgi:putative transposase
MIGALKQLEAGRKAEDVAREVGVSKHTIYAWKANYGGMDVSEAQEAKQLRDENTKLRKPVADLSKAATGRLAAMPLAASVKILQIEMPQNQSRTREPRATREPGNHCASPVLKFGRWKTYLMEPEVTSPIRAAVGAMDKKSLVSYF